MDPLTDPAADLFEMPLTGPRSVREEIANSVTHGLGLLLALVGSWVMLRDAYRGGDPWHIAGCWVFSATMTATYLFSTLSHVFQRPKVKSRFRRLDQGVIYLFVVGSYVPWGLVYLRTGWPLWLMIAMCVVAMFGFISKVCFAHRVESVSVALYVVLGWLPIVMLPRILAAMPHAGLWWMLIGGLCYTSGIVFLLLDERRPFFHAVWHKLVIAGSMCQWYAIWMYVSPNV